MKSLYAVMLFACAFVLAGVQPVGTQNGNAAASSSTAPVTLKGTLERIKIHGKSLEGNLLGETADPEVSIYLPPSYSTDRNRRYPVVYLLHGYTNSDLGYFGSDGRKLHLIAERVFAEWRCARNDSRHAQRDECVWRQHVFELGDRWRTGKGTSPRISSPTWTRTIGRSPRATARGLAGHSMGGYGTMRIGMKRPDVFSATLRTQLLLPERRDRPWTGNRAVTRGTGQDDGGGARESGSTGDAGARSGVGTQSEEPALLSGSPDEERRSGS